MLEWPFEKPGYKVEFHVHLFTKHKAVTQWGSKFLALGLVCVTNTVIAIPTTNSNKLGLIKICSLP